ncbi:MAG: hypothetical protein M3N23_10705 [Pseudomonadota bacterium]|nr:hypothetical protein [Pseudomonadota bacterium]
MSQGSVPSKEQVRAYLAQRRLTRLPPPAPAAIRHLLSWGTCDAERYAQPGLGYDQREL